MNFNEKMIARGWSVVPVPPRGAKDGDWFCSVTAGSLLLRKGSVRLEVGSSVLVERPDGEVALYDPVGERAFSIYGIVVDVDRRREGLGRIALRELLEVAREGVDALYLEAAPMVARRFRAKARREDLIAWYASEGFVLVEGSTKVMKIVFKKKEIAS